MFGVKCCLRGEFARPFFPKRCQPHSPPATAVQDAGARSALLEELITGVQQPTSYIEQAAPLPRFLPFPFSPFPSASRAAERLIVGFAQRTTARFPIRQAPVLKLPSQIMPSQIMQWTAHRAHCTYLRRLPLPDPCWPWCDVAGRLRLCGSVKPHGRSGRNLNSYTSIEQTDNQPS